VRARNLINMVAVTVVSCAVLLGLLAAIFETTRASCRRRSYSVGRPQHRSSTMAGAGDGSWHRTRTNGRDLRLSGFSPRPVRRSLVIRTVRTFIKEIGADRPGYTRSSRVRN
jgi:hypothetical protein